MFSASMSGGEIGGYDPLDNLIDDLDDTYNDGPRTAEEGAADWERDDDGPLGNECPEHGWNDEYDDEPLTAEEDMDWGNDDDEPLDEYPD